MDNPLLSGIRPIRFSDVQPEHIRPAVDAAIQESRRRMVCFLNDHNDPDFIRSLDEMTLPLDEVMTIVSHLESTVTTEELRQAYSEVQADVSSFLTSITLNPQLWETVKSYAESEGKNLTGARKRFLQQTMDDFLKGGANLPELDKKLLERFNVELADLCLKFSQNSLDASNDWDLYVSEDQLSGLPQSAKIAMAEEAAREGKTGFRITLKAPCYSNVMKYADARELRATIYKASNSKATSGEWDNRPLMKRILQCRKNIANLLGYENFADFVLSDRMAKTGTTARSLLANLRMHAEPKFLDERNKLQTFRDELEGEKSTPLEMWDVAYYAEKMRKAHFDFDSEELREYFEYDSVLKGVFKLAESLYGVRVVPWFGMQVWHETVKGYRLYSPDGLDMGGFYVDPFPRESKGEGAWMLGIVNGIGEVPFAGICMNFTPPQANRPSLLSHYEVETLFHEFGHLLHHMMSKASLHSHFGTSVAWDFVELPSQVMENWTWDWECLQTFAIHYKTGKPLPKELFDKLWKTKHFMAATYVMQFTGYSSMDLMLHMDYDPEGMEDPVDVSRDFLQQFAFAKLEPTGQRLSTFTHVFGDPIGYSAGYYSYQWAEVLDADAFDKFKEIGHMSREAGQHFLDTILSKGDEEDPSILFRNFMGRDPNLHALLKKYGIQ